MDTQGISNERLILTLTIMSVLINEDQLRACIANSTFIKNGKVENIEGGKYDFTLGTDILKSLYAVPINVNNLPEIEKSKVQVDPGEIVFVLTEEILELPNNILATLVPKRKLSHDGIMVLGGLSVDPLYEGRLLVGLYNFSSSPYPIIPGKKLIAAHFYRLTDEEVSHNQNKPDIKVTDFPEDLIRLISKYRPVSNLNLLEKINLVEGKIDSFKEEFRSKDDWFKKFQESLEGHDKNIDKLLVTLEKEIDDRRKSDKDLDDRMRDSYDKANDNIQKYTREAIKTGAAVAAIGSLVISILIYFLQNYMLKK
ncbi:MAG: dCTP deaminase domain-containing protein [Bacteroidota bacterium]